MGAEDGGASGTEADSVSCPLTTKAVRIFEHGSADVLRYEDYLLQRPGPRDVAVRVAAASVSSLDVRYRIGLPPSLQYTGRRTFPLPQQLGREAAVLVVAVGPDVRRFAPGDRVVAAVHPGSPHSVEAARGLGNLSTGVDLPGHQSLAGRHPRTWPASAELGPRRRQYEVLGVLVQAAGAGGHDRGGPGVGDGDGEIRGHDAVLREDTMSRGTLIGPRKSGTAPHDRVSGLAPSRTHSASTRPARTQKLCPALRAKLTRYAPQTQSRRARPTSASGRWTRCHRRTSPSARAVAPPFASTAASR